MKLGDEYLTLAGESEGLYKEKGSRFIGIALPVETAEEVKTNLDRIKKAYHDARHHCYAYRLGAEPYESRFNDDGEPSGTAGKPIYGQIQSFVLTNVLIVVVRYFGGVKLGTGGLLQAYKAASREAIANGSILTKTWMKRIELHFNYLRMNDIMHLIKEEGGMITSQEFALECSIKLEIRMGRWEMFVKKLSNLDEVTWAVI